PGVYYWKDANDNIIYIGKAKNLKKRINDYLNFRTHSFLINHLFKIANSIDWLVLKSEKDALIKEAQEINKYQPRLNIRLKYSKPFKYLGIFLQKKNIQIKLVNSYIKHKNSFCLGPFSRIQSIKNLRKLILENFLYKDGLKVTYKYEKEANLTFIKLRKLFASNLNFLIKNLKEKLDQASKSPELYELGKKYLNQLSALKDLNIKSEFTIKNQSLINIVVFKQKNNYLMVRVFHFMGGNLIYEYADYFFMWKDLKDIVYEFLQIYYLTHQKPKTIYTNYEIDNSFLDLNIKKPKKSEYYKKINYFLDNSFFELNEKIKNDHINKNKMNDGWLELKNLLNLTKLEEIAIIDNSFLAN
ncbi:MAG: hypothetical protein E7Y34_02255, partial [Mycoplasma sp.]|nr:hypothetical protein [Mycoplasma sp.]